MQTKSRKGKKFFIITIVCLVCLLVNLFWSDYKTANAFATPYDAIGSILFEMSFYFAGLAAGEDAKDVVKENPYKDSGNSITSNTARGNYVRECFPENKMVDLGWDQTSYLKFVESMTAIWSSASYVLNTKFCDKIWQNLPTDGTAALKPESFVTNTKGASILHFPQPSPGPDEGEEGDEEEYKEALKLFDPKTNSIVNSAFTGIFSTKAFLTVYKALLKANADNLEKKFTSDGRKCDYRVDFWKENPAVLTVGGDSFNYTYGLQFNFAVASTGILNLGDLVYPLIFSIDNIPQIGFAATQNLKNLPYGLKFIFTNNLSGSNSSNNTNLKHGGYAPIIAPSLSTHTVSFGNIVLNDVELGHYYDAFRSRGFLYQGQTDVRVWDDYLIDVGNLENFQKWSETVLTENYALKDLLKLMKKGWELEINDGEKEWEGVKNNGKTAKETLTNPEKAPKYEAAPGRVSLDSIIQGMQSEASLELPNGQPAYEFLGDPTPGVQAEPAENLYGDLGYGTLPGSDLGAQGSWWGGDYNPLPDPSTGGGSGGGSGNDDNDKDKDNPKKPLVPGIGEAVDSGGNAVNWYQRFPFCIPWDVYHFIAVFNGQKKAPKWDIPFKIKRLNISEKITFDFADYEEVVKVIRVFLLLFYSSGLVIITRNIIKG